MIDNWRKEEYPDLINLTLGALLIASPWAFGFMAVESASWNAVLSGSLITLLSLIGLALIVEWPAWWNFAAGMWVTVSPWLLTFASNTVAVRVHCLVGASIALVSLVRISFGSDPRVTA
jgi:hypothetical protein